MSEVYLRWGHYAESVHDAIRILLSNFADKQRAHARTGSSTQGVCELEALEAVAALCLLPHHIQDRVHQLGSLSVVAFGPVITCSALAWGTCKYMPVSQLCIQNLPHLFAIWIHSICEHLLLANSKCRIVESNSFSVLKTKSSQFRQAVFKYKYIYTF